MSKPQDKTNVNNSGLSEQEINELEDFLPGLKDAVEKPDEDLIKAEAADKADDVEDDDDSDDEEPIKEEDEDDDEEEEESPEDIEDEEDEEPQKSEEDVEEEETPESAGTNAVLELLKNNPEKLEQLRNENPELVKKLEAQFPGALEVEASPQDAEKDELVSLLNTFLEKEENKAIEAWRKKKKITKEDFAKREAELKKQIKVLMNSGLADSVEVGLSVMGPVIFPHTAEAPVDENKLKKIKGKKGGKPSSISPGNSGSLSKIDKKVMKQAGIKDEKEYKNIQSGPLQVPGLDL